MFGNFKLYFLNYVFFANIDFGVHIERDNPKHKTNYKLNIYYIYIYIYIMSNERKICVE